MGAETEESGSIQATATTPSTASASRPKMSILGRKSGFVIPKNKLSGSMVPLFHGSNKGDGDSVNEESTNQVQRKTKWGPDLILDTAVRKGRVFAYQTRINQISEQLNLGALAIEYDRDSSSAIAIKNGKSSDEQHTNEKMEMLELERREIIGEILKLTPSYKAPADYKPLLKEAKVLIPIKEYPSYNFISLVFGPASDTQKRLEKETGAKIRVFGTKSDTGGKVEVSPADAKELTSAYEDLYVHVSADAFEKVDAAVALIELLVTPVSLNAVSSTKSSASDDKVEAHLGQTSPGSAAAPTPVNQEILQPYTSHSQPSQSHFPQYSQAWFPGGPTQIQTFPQSGLVGPANSSAQSLSNPAQGSSSTFNSSSMPSFFGPRPLIQPSFSPLSQNIFHDPTRPQLSHSSRPSFMQQAPQPGQTGGPGNIPMGLPRPPSNTRPIAPPSPGSSPLAAFPVATTASQGLPVLSHGINNMSSQNAPSNMISPMSGSSQSRLLPPASGSMPSAIGPMQPPFPPVTMRGPSPDFTLGQRPTMPFTVAPSLPQSGTPNSVSSNFDSARFAISRPQPPSGDFTFQPHRPSNVASHIGWQNNQHPNHNIALTIRAGQAPLRPQPPLIRPVTHTLEPPVHGFPRSVASHQMNQPRGPISPNFPGNQPVPINPPLPGHMQPRNIFPPHSAAGPYPPRPGSQMHLLQNHPLQRPSYPDQHFGNRPMRPPGNFNGAQQIYDPFSPTAAPLNPQAGANVSKLQNESDPEYEDLMASVGVK